MDKRKLQIISRSEASITEQQLTCFVGRLSADLQRSPPLFTWLPDKEAGTEAFYAIGLSEGSLFKLRACSFGGESGTVMSHFRNNVLMYQATEFDGTPTNHGHLAYLHRMVATRNRKQRR